MKQVIYIKDYLPSTITSRKAIDVIKSQISLVEYSSYIIDFSEIDFISRAFADELVHCIKEKNSMVEFSNANLNICEILNAVQKNRSKRNNSFHEIAVTPFLKKEELNDFLSLI